MKSVIVISAKRLDLDRVREAYCAIGTTDIESSERLVVQGDWGWFAICLNDNLEADFEDDELHTIRQRIPRPFFTQLEFSSTSAGDLAIEGLPTASDTLVDNDHGAVMLIDDVRNRIKAKLEWQRCSALD